MRLADLITGYRYLTFAYSVRSCKVFTKLHCLIGPLRLVVVGDVVDVLQSSVVEKLFHCQYTFSIDLEICLLVIPESVWVTFNRPEDIC